MKSSNFPDAYRYKAALSLAQKIFEKLKDEPLFQERALHLPWPSFDGAPSAEDAKTISMLLNVARDTLVIMSSNNYGPSSDPEENELSALAAAQRVVMANMVLENEIFRRTYERVAGTPEFVNGFVREQFEPDLSFEIDLLRSMDIKIDSLVITRKRLYDPIGRVSEVLVVDVPESGRAGEQWQRQFDKEQRMRAVGGFLAHLYGDRDSVSVSKRYSTSRNQIELYIKGVSAAELIEKLEDVAGERPHERPDRLRIMEHWLPVYYIDMPVGNLKLSGSIIDVTNLYSRDRQAVLTILRGVAGQRDLSIDEHEGESTVLVPFLKPEDIQRRLPGAGREIGPAD